MGLLRFLAERRSELLLLTGQHVLLVLVSAGLAVAIGVPLALVASDSARAGAVDSPLLAALKEWRRRRARADGVPAYVVLHDAHLQTIAAEQPTSLVRLARCPGIGPTKLERYGDEIVAIVADAASE